MKSRKLLLIGGAVLVVLIVVIAVVLNRDDPVEKKFKELRGTSVNVPTADENALRSIKWIDVGNGNFAIEGELNFDQVVALLRKRYGGKLDHPLMQMRMLEELIRYLKKKYPKDWVVHLKEILQMAFPDMAARLFLMSEKMYKYDKFLNDSRLRATVMNESDREKMLWDERHALFGEEADLLWGAEKRQRMVTSTLKEIESKKGTPIPERIDQFKQALRDTYGDQLPRVMENRRQNFLDGFVNAVQEDLQQMSPSQRSEALVSIRRGMGLDENAIERWRSLDEERDQRWSNGQLYMAERKEIIAKYSGEEREKKLDEVRRRLFNDEADSIRNEEAAGYFRFQEKRKYGFN